MTPPLRSGAERDADELASTLRTGLLLAILILALALRLLALWSLSDTPYARHLVIDESVYHSWATQIAEGRYRSSTTYQFSPLPAYVTAAVYRLFGPDAFYVRILNILLGTATCFLIYRLARSLAGDVAGLAAALIAAAYEPFIFYSIVPLKASLSVFLFTLMIMFFVRQVRAGSFPLAFALGLTAGLLLTVRENALAVLPFLVAFPSWECFRKTASPRQAAATCVVVSIGALLAAGPFVVRNYLVAGELAITGQQAGLNLYIGNNLENGDPYYRPVRFAESFPQRQAIQFRIEASKRSGRVLSPGETSRYWMGEVVQSAWERPGACLWKLWQKTLVVFNRFEAGDHYDIEFMGRFAGFFRFPWLTFGIILPLGLAGLIVSASQSRISRDLAVLLLVYAATLVLFFTNARYRLPLAVTLVPFAVIGVRCMLTQARLRRFRPLAAYGVLVTSFLVLAHLPVQGTDDRTAYYNLHAVVLTREGNLKEALSFWEQSAEMNKPFSAYANLALGQQHFLEQDYEKTKSYLDRIPDESFAAALKYEMLGDVHRVAGNAPAAMSAYRDSLAVNSGRLSPRVKLISLLGEADPDQAGEEMRRLTDVRFFYTGP